MSVAPFDVGRFLDEQKLGPLQVTVLCLCTLVMICDGYDVFVMGFVLQPIARDFHVSPASITPVFVLQNVGLALGTYIAGPLADRFGRRLLILVSVTCFGLLTLATARAADVTTLIALRFFAGLFFAGLIPNAIALTTEFAPLRLRATLVTWMFIGYTGGAALGGLVVAALLPRYGWPSAFWVGGGVPLVLAVLLAFLLPESVRFAILRDPDDRAARRMLTRLAPDLGLDDGRPLVIDEVRIAGSSVAALFRSGRHVTTACVWLAYFTNLMVITILGAFLPTFLHRFGGFEEAHAAALTSFYSFSAMLTSLFYGRLLDRFGAAPVLLPTYLLGAVAIVVLGLIDLHSVWIYLVVFCVGTGVITAQGGLNALAATVYPTRIRSTGVGWAFGAGRLGGMVGPFLGGAALAGNWSADITFAVVAVPIVVACLTMAGLMLLGYRKPPPVPAELAEGA